MKTKIRRYIKKHLLPFLFYSFIAIIITGITVVLAEQSFIDRGYFAIGGEYCFPLLVAVIGFAIKFKIIQ